jgi:hypothetical protein
MVMANNKPAEEHKHFAKLLTRRAFLIIAGCQQRAGFFRKYTRCLLDVLSFGSRAKTPRSKGKREKAPKSNKRARRTTGLK